RASRSPGSGPASRSRIAAVSRTLRVSTSSHAIPCGAVGDPGAHETRPRVGLRPTSPVHAAGIRIEPPMSLAWAAGTSPAATAEAAPPLEPPGERSGAQGFAHGPYVGDSVRHWSA